MTRVEFRVIFEVYYMRSMELPGVIFVSLFLAFSCLDHVRGISESKKEKEKRREFWIARYILDTFCLYTCQTSMLAILLCPYFLDENCGFQLLGDEPSKSSIMSN